jgi:hypothetical protein
MKPYLLFLVPTLWLEACGSSGLDPSSPLSSALFETVQPLSDDMILSHFVWQDDIVGVAQ